ncbi:hypothetical protein C1H46_032331 [Malus baccata]|uniref:Hexosyltransferase n=1 Tax=Malus baccata TaxID=106549 RepID=A0A540L6I5_MALBA|nr:hypothetical protein C1H46_032331 [Malus baccata]
MKSRNSTKISATWIPIFCIPAFLLGMLITGRMWTVPESNGQLISIHRQEQELQIVSEDCATKKKHGHDKNVMDEIYKTHESIHATSNSILDRAIDSEDAQHNDFLRLEHVEGMLATTLARHRSKPRVYIGCMKSGPVLAQKNVKYHEPEYWKFGEEGNKYFRHATGQIYAISRDLATYVSINQPILHKYANEDVSLGSWFIGLDVEHIDERNMCCRTPPDCEWKAQAGNMCIASFDWSCSGICKSVERIKSVHEKCGEGDAAVWSSLF